MKRKVRSLITVIDEQKKINFKQLSIFETENENILQELCNNQLRD